MKKKRPLFWTALTGSVMLALLINRPVTAQAAETENVVRVAYPVQKGLTDLNENGEFCGYTYEYLQEIAQYTGWQYEFVQAQGDEDEQLMSLMELLDRGEIDLMGGMLYSEEQAERTAYSSQSYGTVETVLQTTSDKMGLVNIDSGIEQTLRIAVLNPEGRSVRELEDYCKMNLVQPVYVVCKDKEDQKRAVEEDRADALLNNSVNPMEGVCTIARFSPKPFYFVVSQQARERVLKEIDESIRDIVQMNPRFSSSLFEKYFADGKDALELTAEEQAYVKRAGTLRLGVTEGQPPFYTTGDGKEAGTGIDAGMAALIEEKTGLHLELVPAPDLDTLTEMAASGEVDLIAGVAYDYENAAKRNLSLTQPYLSLQYVLIMRPDINENELQGKRLAMTKSSTYEGYTVGAPAAFPNRSGCVLAVQNGEADYTYVDACTAQYYGNQPEFWSLRQTPLSYREMELSYGLARPVDKTLLGILNKAVLMVTTEESQAVITDCTIPERKLSFLSYMRLYPLQILAVFLTVTAALAILVLLRYRAGRQLRLEMKKREQVYELGNDYFFEYHHRTSRLTIANPLVEGKNSGMTQFDYSQPVEDNECGREFLRTVSAGKDGEFEFQDLCVDGRLHWLHVVQKTIRDASGKPSCSMGKVKIIDTERKERMQLLERAQHDGLTGVYNAGTFRTLALEALASPERKAAGALILIDIDHFKEINDIYGHMQGDRALVWFAGVLKERFEKGGFVGRCGGDEFIVWQDGAQKDEALDRLCAGLCRAVRGRSAQGEEKLTISVGAVAARGAQSYEELFQEADRALYRVKEAGRDGYCISEAGSPEAVHRTGDGGGESLSGRRDGADGKN